MSRMTRADFLRTCAAGGLAAITMGQLPLRAANNALPRMQAQRVIQHLSELPTDRAPVVTCVSLSPDLQILATAGVNVEYMYAFVQHSGKNAVIIFRFDNLEQAISLLQKEGIHIYKGEEVYRL